MKIIEERIFRGPNHRSVLHQQLIDLRIDAGTLRHTTMDNIRFFEERLRVILPGLFGKGSQEFKRDVPLSELVAIITKELQQLAGMACEHIATHSSANSNEFHTVYSYSVEPAGVFAGETAVHIIETLARDTMYDEIAFDLEDLNRLKYRYSTGPTTTYILNEFRRRRIPYKQFNEGSLILLGHGMKQKKIRTAITGITSGLGMELASDKDETKRLLWDYHVPVPQGILVSSENELRERIEEVRFPLVVKPLNGNHGRGVTTDIKNLQEAIAAYDLAKRISPTAIVEEFIKGNDYRFLVINYELVAVTLRTPATVTGNGKSTIQELIDEENRNPERGQGPEFVLALIRIDETTEKIMAARGYTLQSVLPPGQVLVLKETANISSGGIATDVTDTVHPKNRFFAERIARIFNLDICGIDVMATGVDQPITRETGAVIEVNAGPGLRMHSNPQRGIPRNVAGKIADMLFPDPITSYIPLTAIAGFESASLLARLLSHILNQAGFKPGCATSDGIFVQEHMSCDGNCTGFESEKEVLFDPTINTAVIECSAASVYYSGLGFDRCDISILTGMDEKEQVNSDDRELAELLVTITHPRGTVIVNADDDTLLGLGRPGNGSKALFSTDPDNDRLKLHCSEGGLAAVLDQDKLFIYEGMNILSVIRMGEIPFAAGRGAKSAPVVLPAVLAALLLKVPVPTIREGLLSFPALKLKFRMRRGQHKNTGST